MKKTLYIHIGAHKTGSSAIQQFLASNRHILRKNGYLYPKMGGFAHHKIPHMMMRTDLSKMNEKMIIKKVLFEMRIFQCQNLIFSSEIFENFSQNKFNDKIKLLKQIIPENIDIKIIYYVRRQDDRFESTYNQRVKDNLPKGNLKFNDFIGDAYFPFFDYYFILSPWRDIFGIKNIRFFIAIASYFCGRTKIILYYS